MKSEIIVMFIFGAGLMVGGWHWDNQATQHMRSYYETHPTYNLHEFSSYMYYYIDYKTLMLHAWISRTMGATMVAGSLVYELLERYRRKKQ